MLLKQTYSTWTQAYETRCVNKNDIYQWTKLPSCQCSSVCCYLPYNCKWMVLVSVCVFSLLAIGRFGMGKIWWLAMVASSRVWQKTRISVCPFSWHTCLACMGSCWVSRFLLSVLTTFVNISFFAILPLHQFSGHVEQSVFCLCVDSRPLTFELNDLENRYLDLIWIKFVSQSRKVIFEGCNRKCPFFG